MRPVLLVRNYPGTETFGTAPAALGEAGVPVRTLNATDPGEPRPAVEDLGGLVMFGGDMNVDETNDHPHLKENRELTREAVERGVPFLGICLGAQMLARALDGSVFPGPVREFGFEPVRPTDAAAGDPLLAHYADGDRVFQWHQDTLETPAGSTLLATGDGVRVQAYRVGDLAWGVQFHLEVDEAELKLWLDEATDQGLDLPASWGKSAGDVRDEATRHLLNHEAKGRELFTRFARVVREVGT